mmetsp:Transcript_29513/g.44868  ORF Transcript_29513/g.44868 Transcript_29513/m.44868 type:complete len:223 (+) Transcript_29513:2421-3089(+)
MSMFQTQRKHVLVQGLNGKGAMVQIDETGRSLQAVCELTDRTVNAKTDLSRVKKGWHNIIVMCDNQHKDCEGQIKFFIDGLLMCEPQKCVITSPIGFIGNSKSGQQPFGMMSDLRAFPYVISAIQLERLSTYHEELEFDMPDKYNSTFVEMGMIKLILDDMNNYARADTKCNLCRVLNYLSNHSDCRAYILKYNGLEKAMEMTMDPNHEIQFEALRLVQNLQ